MTAASWHRGCICRSTTDGKHRRRLVCLGGRRRRQRRGQKNASIISIHSLMAGTVTSADVGHSICTDWPIGSQAEGRGRWRRPTDNVRAPRGMCERAPLRARVADNALALETQPASVRTPYSLKASNKLDLVVLRTSLIGRCTGCEHAIVRQDRPRSRLPL